MNANDNVPSCSVCGGALREVGRLLVKQSRVIRFKCTCGHVEDHAETAFPKKPVREDLSMPEGIQDNLSELSFP